MIKRIKSVLALLLFGITVYISAVYFKPFIDNSSAEISDFTNQKLSDIFGNISLTEPARKEKAAKTADAYLDTEIPASFSLEIPEVMQIPELPTGCESVALTMNLMYLGYELEKTTIADAYLNYDNDNLALGYSGDPYSYEGAGCFPPAIADAADAYLKEMESEKRSVDVSGSSLDSLFHYVANGVPVIVWSTMYMAEFEATEALSVRDGKEYAWYLNEHCVVLAGYDQEQGILLINDPLEGIMERDLESFEAIYNAIGQYAVIIP